MGCSWDDHKRFWDDSWMCMGCLPDGCGMYLALRLFLGCAWGVFMMILACFWDVYVLTVGKLWDVYGMVYGRCRAVHETFLG